MMEIKVTLDLRDPKEAKALADFALAMSAEGAPKTEKKNEPIKEAFKEEASAKEEVKADLKERTKAALEEKKRESVKEEPKAEEVEEKPADIPTMQEKEEIEALEETSAKKQPRKPRPAELVTAIFKAQTPEEVVEIVGDSRNKKVLEASSERIDDLRQQEDDEDNTVHTETAKQVAEEEEQEQHDLEDNARKEIAAAKEKEKVDAGEKAPDLKAIRTLLNELLDAHRSDLKAKLSELGAPNLTKLDTDKHLEFYTFLQELKNG